ncbi:neuropeptide CCHamide-2 receptor [Phlebotomus argentipes]|uniref:neuropeptide CCHamide-2 receptor n=1 Tax=Phlebotomus argentipes TaxID=94469 RepID=UPI0028934210|nr:neuropeptide CCHamide-2 receptor [Phlebotomus argentipes]
MASGMDENFTGDFFLNASEDTLFTADQTFTSDMPNATNPSDDYTPYPDRPETYIVPVVFSIIFVVGVLGNGTLVVVFVRHRAMRNIPNTYIFSLALADLLVILICVPLTSIIYTMDSWPWGETLCRVSEFAKDISIGVSVFTLTALSGERYCAIVNPLRKLQTKPLTVFTAVMIWIIAILFALPVVIRSTVVERPVNRNKTILICDPFGPEEDSFRPTYRKYAVIGKAVTYYFLPLTIIGILYALMARRLHLSAREMPGESLAAQSRSQARARRHVARMVVTFVIVFIVCFLPHHIFQMWFHLYPDAEDDYDEVWHVFRIIGFCFGFLNSCANPVALYCVSGVFRQYYHRYLCCRRSPSHRAGHSTATGVCDTSFTSTVRRATTQVPLPMGQNPASNHWYGNGSDCPPSPQCVRSKSSRSLGKR